MHVALLFLFFLLVVVFRINFEGDELAGGDVRVREGGGAELMWGGVGNIGSATSMFNIVQHCSKHCSTLFNIVQNFVHNIVQLCSQHC